MKVSYAVLKEFIPDLNLSADEVADRLTMQSYEVESVTHLGQGLQNVLVGKIEAIAPHPNADRLQITQVNVGAAQNLTIVCGASNIAVGQIVPVAMIGASLPNGITIKETEIRGQLSQGMLCSGEELGLEDVSGGIFLLAENLEPGRQLVEVMGLDDAIIELDSKGLGTRASDSSSFHGLARELGTILNKPVATLPTEALPKTSSGAFTIHRDPEICSYYSLLEIDGLTKYDYGSNVHEHEGYRVDLYVQVDSFKIEPAIRRVLERVGHKTRIPVVDLGNYIMEETGQPVHVFDAEKVAGNEIIIRKASAGEKMESLDGTTLDLDDGDIVICDQNKILALAGIIGAKNSGVDESTKHVLVESANFDKDRIRRTARRLKMLTDAAKRFERGLPVELSALALERMNWFFKKGGVKSQGWYHSGHSQSAEISTKLSFDYVRSYVGIDISNADIEKILRLIGAVIQTSDAKEAKVIAPHWRLDLTTQEEYIEEISRVYGYDKIPARTDFLYLTPHHDSEYVLKRGYSVALVGQGYSEMLTHPYTEQESVYLMINPVDGSRPYLRQNLAYGLRQVEQKNSRDFESIKIFEIGRVFQDKETLHLAMLSSGSLKTRDSLLSDLYADFIRVSMTLGLKAEAFDFSLTDTTMEISYKGTVIGGIDYQYDVLEVCLDTLITYGEFVNDKYASLSKYPTVKRDLTLSVPRDIRAKQLWDTLNQNKPELCESMSLKDVYHTETESRYTFHFRFRSPERSLSDEEVNQEILKLEKLF